MGSRGFFVFIALAYLYPQCQGDINQDNNLDVTDITLITQHIMSHNISSDSLLELADYNSDQNIDILDILCFINIILSPNLSCEDIIIEGITETNENGELVGSIDEEDWCEFEFDMSNMEIDYYGLNPAYPNPVSSSEWGAFGTSYQLCYQFSCPTSDFSLININIVSAQNDTIYTFTDSYGYGQAGLCAYINKDIVLDSMYRMIMKSGDFQCHGDIQFLE